MSHSNNNGEKESLLYRSQTDDEELGEKLGMEELLREDHQQPKSSSRKKKFSTVQKIVLTGLIFISLAVVIAVAAVLSKKEEILETTTKKVTRDERKLLLEDVLTGRFSYDTYSTTWISDNEYIHEDNGALMKYNTDERTTTTIMDSLQMAESSIDKVKRFSADKKYFLFSNHSKQLYRHSFYADYYVKELKFSTIRKIKPPKIVGEENDGEQIRYAGWSTNGSALVFVYRCNIYFIDSMEGDMTQYQITKDGKSKMIFNGVPDWVYEEEIIASTHAMEFSSDGRYLAYVNFNATAVPFYKFPRYGSQYEQYTSIEKIAYPKAGYPNPTVVLNIVDLDSVLTTLSTTKTVLMPPEELYKGGEYYYAVIKWNLNKHLYVQWMNREQTNTVYMLYDPASSTGRVIVKDKVKNGWVDDDYVKPYFSKDGSYYITMLPKDVGNSGKFRHIAKVATDGSGTEFLTDGEFTVQDLNCYNEDDEAVYYRSTEGSSRYRQVYKLDVNTKETSCVSCGLIRDEDTGQNCTYHYPQFSKQCSWVTLMCQGPFVPQTSMYGLRSKTKMVLTTNARAKKALQSKDLPIVHYYKIKSDGFDIPVRETRPPNFNPQRKYAVLFDVYGGPNTQKVNDRFGIEFPEHFTSYDVIIVRFDARGSGYRGYKFLHAVYKNLGKYETIDTINVAKYLQKQSYVDPNRMAIWGWSYGGFYAATVLADSEGLVNTAVSVAPVSDWRYYDTVYSERYMGIPSPQDNLDGYESTSLMTRADKFHNKNFLLIHGTADDNVHFQNSAQLSSALIRNKVKFRTQYFPDRDHSIQSRGYVYMLVQDYLLEELKTEHRPILHR